VVANIDSVCVLSEFDFKVLKNTKYNFISKRCGIYALSMTTPFEVASKGH